MTEHQEMSEEEILKLLRGVFNPNSVVAISYEDGRYKTINPANQLIQFARVVEHSTIRKCIDLLKDT